MTFSNLSNHMSKAALGPDGKMEHAKKLDRKNKDLIPLFIRRLISFLILYFIQLSYLGKLGDRIGTIVQLIRSPWQLYQEFVGLISGLYKTTWLQECLYKTTW